MQVSPDELVADAEHLFSIVMCDAEFVGVMKRLDHHQATDAVYEAVKMLQTAPTPPPKPDDEAERIQYLDLSSEVMQVNTGLWICVHILYICVGLSGGDAISTMAGASSH